MCFPQSSLSVEKMKTMFEEKFLAAPSVCARAPGRVNLIGEHIDYSGFAVFPMAIAGKDTYVLAGVNSVRKIRGRNVDSEHFPDFDIDVDSRDKLVGNGWAKYVEAIVKKYIIYTGDDFGVDLLVYGEVPIASGLSSSAALLCSVVVAIAKMRNNEKNNYSDFIKWTIEAEHWVGVNSGGMDQSISMYGEEGCACIIGFCPPSVEKVKLPDAHFIVANSMVRAAKVEGYDENCYNHRVLEVKRASQLMNSKCATIGEVVKEAGGFENAIELANKLPEKEGNLVIRKRALHVLNEAKRVLQMKDASLEQWGKLMCESHESCKDLYGCSCDELDELVKDGMEAGALGGRLTGAGWGGCTIFILSPDQDTELFIQKLKDTYYKKHNITNPIVFSCKPGPGAQAFKFE